MNPSFEQTETIFDFKLGPLKRSQWFQYLLFEASSIGILVLQ